MGDLLDVILNLPPERAKNALTYLDPLERQVLEILLEKKVALTAQQIIDSLVEKLADSIIEKIGELEETRAIVVEKVEKKEKIPVKFTRLKKPIYVEGATHVVFEARQNSGELDIPLFEDTYYPGKVYVKLSELVKAVNEYFKELPNAKTRSDLVALKRKLVSNFCEIPSFRRIESSILPELVAMGLVIAREPVSKKRAKKLYAVNPVLFEVLK